jgi:uncharacterized protein
LEDVQSAIAFVRSDESVDEHRGDPSRVALIGNSMGGWASLMTASEDPAILGAASLAGWNIGLEARLLSESPREHARLLGMIDESMGPLHPTFSDPLAEEIRHHGVEWDVELRTAELAGRPLFIAAGSRDDEVPPARHHVPLIAALNAAGASRLTELVWDTDHAFSDRRIALARATVEWLRSLLPPGT